MNTSDLNALLQRAATMERVVLASDFDGTLAGFELDPMAVRPLPEAMAALRQAAAVPDTTVALVSGRDLPTLRLLSGLHEDEPIVLIGSHGAETSLDGIDPTMGGPSELTADQVELLEAIETALGEICRRFPGAWIESKVAARALHTRPLSAADSDAALAAAHELAATQFPQVTPMNGKFVVELPVLEASKGLALSALVAARQANACIYFGDDVTDEKAFAVLDPSRGDVSVKVGEGDTAAMARVPGIEEVARALTDFARWRAAHQSTTNDLANHSAQD